MELYSNAGKPWSQEEDEKLKDLYLNKKLSVLEICQIHKRFPGGIMSRIKSLGLVTNDFEIRDFEKITEYIRSEEFQNLKKEVLNARKLNKTKSNPTNEMESMKESIVELKNEIQELKNVVKELIYQLYK
jgi:hypothetical protein